MPEDLKVIGVYTVAGRPDVHLIEVASEFPAAKLDIAAFTQEEPSEPRES